MKKSMLSFLLVPGLLLSWGCNITEEPAPLPVKPGPDQLTQASTSGPISRLLGDELERHYADVEGLTHEQLLELHQHDYLEAPDFDITLADHYSAFVDAFGLSTAAQETLDQLGFVVVPAPARQPSMEAPTTGAGPADVFYRVFENDLPVFVSADAILHAWHRSFDKLLEVTETVVMEPALRHLLDRTISALDDDDDALFYLAVARALLEPDWPLPATVEDEVERYLTAIHGHQLQRIEFMGELTYIDFSQFIPRGHYTRSELLKRYFLSMMWLGRTDLVLHPTCVADDARPREEAAARALASALSDGGGLPFFATMDRIYGAYVGKTNALTPVALLALCEEAGLTGCVGDAGAMQETYAAQPAPEYSSRVFACDTPPIAMRFFPQRFGYGAWVTAQTTTPRLKPAVVGGRAMAMVEDVAFALGADRAVGYFGDEMAQPNRQNLPATLEAIQRTVLSISPTTVDDTVYNHWLEGLMALGATDLDPALPQVLRSATWHDRKLEAMLASWAELRHDTILIVEQSTGGIGCQYPRGYVEPVAGLYRSLGEAAVRLRALYVEQPDFEQVPAFFDHWIDVLGQLEVLANRELAGEPMSAEELAFLNEIVDTHGESYYGARVFDGWYPRLFWTWEWRADGEPAYFEDDPSGISEPLVADVHTDAENGLALEVATGHPGLMIVAIDNQGDLSLYGGPVASFFDFSVPLDGRLTDERWVEKVDADQLPARPPFARAYWAD